MADDRGRRTRDEPHRATAGATLGKDDGELPAEARSTDGAEGEKRDLVRFTRRVLVFLLLVGLAAALWQIASLLILVFGGILFAVVLRRLAHLLARWTPLSPGGALATVLVLLVALLVGAGWLFGQQIAAQAQQLSQILPKGIDQLRQSLQGSGLSGLLPRQTGGSGGGLLGSGLISGITGAASILVDALAGILVVAFTAIYLAASPGLYRRGLLLLLPKNRHERAGDVLDATGRALWLWMVGQFVSMLTIGVLVTLALWLLGVPMALALGLIAGVLEFIPILGPWLAAVPALLVALTTGGMTVVWVALAYLLIQQIESYAVTPLAERWAVSLPPALTVAAAVAFGLLFGFIGLLFATPIAVAAIVIIRMVYVRDTLGGTPSPSNMPG